MTIDVNIDQAIRRSDFAKVIDVPSSGPRLTSILNGLHEEGIPFIYRSDGFLRNGRGRIYADREDCERALEVVKEYRTRSDQPRTPYFPGSLIAAERDGYWAVIESLEKRIIQQALTASKGNQSEASRRISLDRVTLIRKMKDYGLDKKFPRKPGRPRH